MNDHSGKIIYHGAESCLEETLIRLEGDSSFTGTTLDLGDDLICTSTVTGGGIKTVSITTTYLDYTQVYEAEVELTTVGAATNTSLLNWERI